MILLVLFDLVFCRNYIFTISLGYQYSTIEPFIETAKKYAKFDSIYCAVDKTANYPDSPETIFIPVNYPQTHAIYLWRWIIFHDWATIFDDNDYILTADSRDSLFQNDPFDERFNLSDINLFEEASTKTIGSCPYNTYWLEQCWGQESLQRLNDKAILCAGNILARGDVFRSFIKDMLASIPSPTCLAFGVDQGILNHFVYLDLVSKYKNHTMQIWKQGEGPINTIGYSVPESIALDAKGKVLNRDGTASALVHQYDRFQSLKDNLFRTLI